MVDSRRRFLHSFLALFGAAALTVFSPARAEAPRYVENVNYFRVPESQPVDTDGKIEVLEVFNYGCVHCFHFQATVDKWLKTVDSAKVRFAYLPAAFREDFALFARGYFVADALGVVPQTHQGVYDTIWNQHVTVRTLDDLATVYEKFGVPRAKFLATAQSFSVETKLRQSLQMLKHYAIDGTPTLIVAGKYRVTGESAGSMDKIFDVVDFLVAKERASPAK